MLDSFKVLCASINLLSMLDRLKAMYKTTLRRKNGYEIEKLRVSSRSKLILRNNFF